MNRIQALHEISVITETHCHECPLYNPSHAEACGGCEHYTKLRNIGNALILETSQKRKRAGKTTTSTKQGRPSSKPCTLTVSEYKGLKREGLNDMRITEVNGCSWMALRKFKAEHNLVRQ